MCDHNEQRNNVYNILISTNRNMSNLNIYISISGIFVNIKANEI